MTSALSGRLCVFFCARAATGDTRRVRTLELGRNILHKCAERGDKWSVEVKGRLEGCNDLVAEEALYHKSCHSRFVNGLSPVLRGGATILKVGGTSSRAERAKKFF